MNRYETERLILKICELSDAEFFHKLYNTPKFIEYIGDRNIRSIQDAEIYIRNYFLPQIERLGFGNYVVIHKETKQKIGAVGIFERFEFKVPDIGFSFLPEFEGKGYAYESAFKIKEIADQEFKVKKISAFTSKENFSSQKLIERLGLTYQKMITIPGDEQELMYYEN